MVTYDLSRSLYRLKARHGADRGKTLLRQRIPRDCLDSNGNIIILVIHSTFIVGVMYSPNSRYNVYFFET